MLWGSGEVCALEGSLLPVAGRLFEDEDCDDVDAVDAVDADDDDAAAPDPEAASPKVLVFFCGEIDSIQSDTAYLPFAGLLVVSKRSIPLLAFVLANETNAICSSKVFHRQGDMDPRASRRERVMLPAVDDDPAGVVDPSIFAADLV